mmetsp:Transcript_38161/g.77872  ORF Transcript_38161/g.77872 Transcript_38161/m.77872 type:complete len:336 (-) Transcript_38161:503-1510(-)
MDSMNRSLAASSSATKRLDMSTSVTNSVSTSNPFTPPSSEKSLPSSSNFLITAVAFLPSDIPTLLAMRSCMGRGNFMYPSRAFAIASSSSGSIFFSAQSLRFSSFIFSSLYICSTIAVALSALSNPAAFAVISCNTLGVPRKASDRALSSSSGMGGIILYSSSVVVNLMSMSLSSSGRPSIGSDPATTSSCFFSSPAATAAAVTAAPLLPAESFTFPTPFSLSVNALSCLRRSASSSGLFRRDLLSSLFSSPSILSNVRAASIRSASSRARSAWARKSAAISSGVLGAGGAVTSSAGGGFSTTATAAAVSFSSSFSGCLRNLSARRAKKGVSASS